MSDDSFLSDELLRQLMAMGEVDVLVGLATYNCAETIGHVVKTARTAFARHFHRDRTALIIADAGSRDGTLDAARSAEASDFRPLLTSYALRTVHQIAVPYHGVPGKANALRTLFAAAELSRAKVCVVAGADHDGMTPEWIERLARPVEREGFDFVAPLYARQKLDGLLVKNILYPMMRAVYGVRVREPLGGENAFSARLVSRLLGQKLWDTEAARFGIDLALLASAAVGGFRVCEAALGVRGGSRRDGRLGLGPLLDQVMGSLLLCLEMHERTWLAGGPGTEVLIKGTVPEPAQKRARVNRKRLFDRFRSAVRDLGPVLEEILAAETLNGVLALTAKSDREIRFPDELWARTVYDFSAAYRHSVMHRAHLLQAFTPLYLGRVGSFVLESLKSGTAGDDRRLEEICLAFERLRPYLVERWKSSDGR